MKPSNSNGPRPEDFPLGSLESRAAARAFAEHKSREKLVFRRNVTCVGHEDAEPILVSRSENEDCVVEMFDACRPEQESVGPSCVMNSSEVATNGVIDADSRASQDALRGPRERPRIAPDLPDDDETTREARIEAYGKFLLQRRRQERWLPGLR